MSDTAPVSISPARQRAKWLRLIGFGVLLLGMIGATEVYRQGLLASDWMEDPSMVGYNRAESRQMGLLFGRQGAMLMEFNETLQNPRTQAIIILVVAVLLAGGCWYFAHLLDRDNQSSSASA